MWIYLTSGGIFQYAVSGWISEPLVFVHVVAVNAGTAQWRYHPKFFNKGPSNGWPKPQTTSGCGIPVRQALEGGMWGSTRKKTVKMCVFQYVSVSSGKLQRITALIQMELISPCLPWDAISHFLFISKFHWDVLGKNKNKWYVLVPSWSLVLPGPIFTSLICIAAFPVKCWKLRGIATFKNNAPLFFP